MNIQKFTQKSIELWKSGDRAGTFACSITFTGRWSDSKAYR